MEGWGAGVVLAVSGCPHHQRSLYEGIIAGAGGRYSPSLSRRCTHLAVPATAGSAATPPSDKLRSAARHQHSWGLRLVTLDWLTASAQAGRRLDEGGFSVSLEGAAGRAPLAEASWNENGARQRSGSSACSALSVAETRAGQQPQEQQQQQPGASLPSQALPPLSVRPDVAAEGPGGIWAAAEAARVPLTQAGYQPASALLETLRASSARSQAGSSAPSTAGTGWRRAGSTAAVAPAPAASAAWAPRPLTQGLSAVEGAGPASLSAAPGINSLVARLRALPAAGPTPVRPAAAASSPAPALAPPSGLRGTDDLVQRLRSLRQGGGPARPTPRKQLQQAASAAPDSVAGGSRPALAAAPQEAGRVPSETGSAPAAYHPSQDSVSPAGAGCASPPAAGGGGGVFAGIVAVVDPALEPAEQARSRQALVQGGGQVLESAQLGRGATHVVCRPEGALSWLSMGLGIVSPEWVYCSLREGQQQRCLVVSADTSRHLHSEGGGGTVAAGPSATGVGTRVPSSRQARAELLSQLEAGAAPAAAGHAKPLLRQGSMPAVLLAGVAWSVTDPPQSARLDRSDAGTWDVGGAECDDDDVIPDSEEEEEERAGLCFGATQAAMGELLHELAQAGGGAAGAAGRADSAGSAAWQQEPAFHGPALTLLLPQDGPLELGHAVRSVACPAGAGALTSAQLLEAVHGFYDEALPQEEVLALLKAAPRSAAGELLRSAFLEAAPLRRGQLLGTCCSMECLARATRDPSGTVYELRLWG